MFRDDYKACFDDIKGDKALLEKVLKSRETVPKKTNVIKMYRSVISAAAAVFVLAMAGFMYNMGMFDGFLPSDNNEIIITEKTADVENIQAGEKTQEDNIIKEEKFEEKALADGGETALKTAKEEDAVITDVETDVIEEKNENQAENINAGVSSASLEGEYTMGDSASRIRGLETIEQKGLSVFREDIEQSTEKYDEAEKKFSYTDIEETKKVEITYYDEMPAFNDENAGGDVLEYIGETSDGYVKITAFGISEEYMSEIIESL